MEREKQVVPFDLRGKNVRTINQEGEPWFVAKDVAAVLGYTNPRKAVRDHCKRPQSVGGNDSFPLEQQTTIIPESDVYRLIMRSRLPSAESFEQWVSEEVLPTIRKTGGAYLTAEKAEELIGNPDLIIGLAQQVKELREESRKKQEQIEAARPKVLFADAVSVSNTSTLVGRGDGQADQANHWLWERLIMKFPVISGHFAKLTSHDT